MLLEAREMAAKLLRTVLLFGAAVALGCGNNAFRFLVTFPQAPGIKKGSEVRYLGLKVGEVESVLIQPSENGGAPRVAVAVALKGLNAVQIRREDRFSVGLQGLLGEAYLDISPGPQSAPAIPAGSTVSAELVALAPQTASGFIDAISLAAKLNSLPEDKRRELLQTFNKMLDDAINQQNQVPFSPQESRKPHK